MDYTRKIIILILFLSQVVEGSIKFQNIMEGRLEALRQRYVKLYGIDSQGDKLWDAEEDARLSYPKGNKTKLSGLAWHMWRYYLCTVQTLRSLTPSGRQRARSLAAYAGSRARLPCLLCVHPQWRGHVDWYYAESLSNLHFTRMTPKETAIVESNHSLTIYNVQKSDEGVYRCQADHEVGGIVLLEVLDDDDSYNVVKPATSRGPYAAPPQSNHGLTLFTAWSDWSECSTCGKVGRRRRYGMCYVQHARKTTGTSDSVYVKEHTMENTINTTHTNTQGYSCVEGRAYLQEFSDGVPCHSKLMPPCLRDLVNVLNRSNEIMLGMCKVKCQDTIYKNDKTRKAANDSARIHSLDQSSRWNEIDSNDYLLAESPPIINQSPPSEKQLSIRAANDDQGSYSPDQSGSSVDQSPLALNVANSETGFYSIDQSPPRVLEPAHEIVFATRGKPIAIRCPGTILRDIPISWRVGRYNVVPRELDTGTKGRVHLDARDQLQFSAVWKRDEGRYSCWQRSNLAGTVQLVVWNDTDTGLAIHLKLLLAIAVAIIVFRSADRLLRRVRVA